MQSTYLEQGGCQKVSIEFYYVELKTRLNLSGGQCRKPTKAVQNKYRVNKSQEFVIGGYTPGNPLDLLIVGYYENGKLRYAAKVRNGFVSRLRREVANRLKVLETDNCPFANLPEKKRTQWALTQRRDEKMRLA